MASSSEMVEIVLALKNLRQFLSGTDKASKGVEGIGKASEKTGKQAGIGWKSIAKWGGAASVLYGAQRFIRGAVSATEDLGKSTLALNRVTGLDVKTSSEWATVLKARGQGVKPFQMGLIKLSKEMEKARLGTVKEAKTTAQLRKEYEAVQLIGGKKAPAALATLTRKMESAHMTGVKARNTFAALGVSMTDVQKGNVEQVLEQAAEGFKNIKNPATRAALAQQLFSRQGRELAPIFFKGRKAIQEQLDTAGKYVNFTAKNAKQVAEEIKHQRELRMAYLGVQVSLGTALLPVILAITGALVKLAEIMSPLTHNSKLLWVAIGLLTVAFVAYKIAMIAATIATTVFETAAGPVVLIALGVAAALLAIGIAAYFVVKHWDAIKAAALRVFGWLKKNWPLLVGILVAPWAVAAVQIIKHFDDIKRFARVMVNFVIDQLQRLLDWLASVPSKIPGLLGKAGGALNWAVKHRPSTSAFFGGQHGGVVPFASRVLVGERGPEVVSLPAGANVHPLPQPAGFAGGTAFGTAEIVVPVYLDRRVVAQSVARFTSDKMARK